MKYYLFRNVNNKTYENLINKLFQYAKTMDELINSTFLITITH